MSSASAAKALKTNFVASLTTLLSAPIQVVYGPAGTYQADDVVELTDVTMTEGQGAGQSPLRRRNYTFALTGIVSCYRGGDDAEQSLATGACLDILAAIADWLQDSGTVPSTHVNLGGAVEWARLTSWELHEEDEDIEAGRTTAALFTVSGLIRA